MGTVVNGNIWSGACVAGKEITGLVKNGVVFYKREIPTPSVYKRRIMVGDSLNSKILYITLPTDFVVQNNETIIETDTYNAIAKTTNSADTGTPNVDLCYVSSEFTFVGLIGKTQYEIPSDFGTVTSIIDTDDAYRHLYIEDPNIRPIQVGDIITKNTKFYFNVPDDFYLQEPPPGVNGKDVDVIVLNNGLHQFMLRSRDDEIYTAFYLDTLRAEEGNMYEYNRETSTLVKNISMIVGPHRIYQNMHFEGTVTSVATDSTIYPYILVDTTTLGA